VSGITLSFSFPPLAIRRSPAGAGASEAGFALGAPEDLPAARREKYEASGRRSRILVKPLRQETAAAQQRIG